MRIDVRCLLNLGKQKLTNVEGESLMGMRACYERMSQKQLDEIIADQKKLANLGWVDKDENIAEKAKRMLDIEKSWDSLHFLLTGKSAISIAATDSSGRIKSNDPFSVAILGGEPVGPDLGYGPARYLTPKQVKEIAEALKPLEFGSLLAKYSEDDFAEADLYAFNDFDEEIETLEEYFPAMKDFFCKAAANDEAVLSQLL